MVNGVWLVYAAYWVFLILVVFVFERRAARMEKSLLDIRRTCDEMKKQLLRKELVESGKIGDTLLDIYHTLNRITRSLNESGVSEKAGE